MISSSPKHDRVSYCVSGENRIFRKIAIQDIKDFVLNDTYQKRVGKLGKSGQNRFNLKGLGLRGAVRIRMTWSGLRYTCSKIPTIPDIPSQNGIDRQGLPPKGGCPNGQNRVRFP